MGWGFSGSPFPQPDIRSSPRLRENIRWCVGGSLGHMLWSAPSVTLPQMPELSGSELLHEWRRLMDSVVASAASVAGHSELPRQLLEQVQRQLELVQEIVDRERRMQRDLTDRLLAPVDAVFDLLEQSGTMLHQQADTLESAGRALEETSRLMKSQAELFEQTIRTLRVPVELAKASAGPAPQSRKGGHRQPS